VTGEAYLNKYLMEDPSMEDTREAMFLKDAVQAAKEKNVHNFKVAVTKLKTYLDIDKWKINMFTKIMLKIEKDSSVLIEDGGFDLMKEGL
jgi:hypothetical protein